MVKNVNRTARLQWKVDTIKKCKYLQCRLGEEVLVLKCLTTWFAKFLNLISNGLLDRCAIAMCVSK